ncbi:hypothetical protein H632_c3218p0, partial [Helicosporidium sp. ATCC 50920]
AHRVRAGRAARDPGARRAPARGGVELFLLLARGAGRVSRRERGERRAGGAARAGRRARDDAPRDRAVCGAGGRRRAHSVPAPQPEPAQHVPVRHGQAGHGSAGLQPAAAHGHAALPAQLPSKAPAHDPHHRPHRLRPPRRRPERHRGRHVLQRLRHRRRHRHEQGLARPRLWPLRRPSKVRHHAAALPQPRAGPHRLAARGRPPERAGRGAGRGRHRQPRGGADPARDAHQQAGAHADARSGDERRRARRRAVPPLARDVEGLPRRALRRGQGAHHLQRRHRLQRQDPRATPSTPRAGRQVLVAPRAKGRGGRHRGRRGPALQRAGSAAGPHHEPARVPVAHDRREDPRAARQQGRRLRGQVLLRHRFWRARGTGRPRGEHDERSRGGGLCLLRQGHALLGHHGGAPAGAHLHGTRLLPEAQAHGHRQDACPSQGAARRAHAPAHRGEQKATD